MRHFRAFGSQYAFGNKLTLASTRTFTTHKVNVRSFDPNKTCTHDFGKSLYTCNSILVNPINEKKRGGPHTTFRDRGAKVHPSGAIYFI